MKSPFLANPFYLIRQLCRDKIIIPCGMQNCPDERKWAIPDLLHSLLIFLVSRRMGLTSSDKYNSVLFTLELVSLVQTSCAAGTCETIFKGFSDCLLSLGENMVNYPQELDDRENLQTICSYWNDFHSCASTAVADCQEGATDLWENLKLQSRSLNSQGSLFELCSGDNGVSRALLTMEVKILLLCFITLLAWLAFE